MLCKINPTLGGATDNKARGINFLRALQAICTAPAGSTPSVASVSTPTASPVIGTAGSVNVITEVISNTEAGGWTQSSSTNITSNYNASFASPYQLDLYRSSGKTTHPFQKLSFRTRHDSLYNGGFTSPQLLVSYGFNTTPEASGNYLLGTNYPSVLNNNTSAYKYEVNHGYGQMMRVDAGEWLIASTERYFICISGEAGNSVAGTMLYAGLRNTQAWESQYDDNIPLVSFGYDGSSTHTGGGGTNATMWARTMMNTGIVNSSPRWCIINNSGGYGGNPTLGDGTSPLTGYTGSAQSYNTYTQDYFFIGNSIALPLLPIFMGMRSQRRHDQANIGPITDPTTGTFVPPAYPITFARTIKDSFNGGGTAPGIFKSMSGTDAFLQQYYTPGQSFTINNEQYYAYALGADTLYRDLMLVRRA